MSTLSTKLFVLAFASLAVASQACTLASPTEVTMVPAKQDSDATDSSDEKAKDTKSASSTDARQECSSKFTKPDTSKLTACGDNKGHCYPKANMASSAQALWGAESCDSGEVCVADEFLEAGGGDLPKCKASTANGKDGRCIMRPLYAPVMADKRSAGLAEDDCDGGMVCVPCVNPLDGEDSGFCHEMGVMDGACSGGGDTGTTTPAKKAEPLAPCCATKSGKNNGACMPADGVPASMKSDVEQQECASGSMCVPQGMVSEDGPTQCSTFMGTGVCMGKCFNGMLSIAGTVGILDGDGCGDEELCIPCSMIKMQAGDQKVPGCE